MCTWLYFEIRQLCTFFSNVPKFFEFSLLLGWHFLTKFFNTCLMKYSFTWVFFSFFFYRLILNSSLSLWFKRMRALSNLSNFLEIYLNLILNSLFYSLFYFDIERFHHRCSNCPTAPKCSGFHANWCFNDTKHSWLIDASGDSGTNFFLLRFC